MRVERIILRYVRLPLRTAFVNRWQRISEWTKLLVELRAGDAVGFGESMAMETPYYCYETIDTAWLAITRFFADRLLALDFEHPREVSDAFAIVSGHHEARAALECACWDLYARARGEPLYALVGGERRLVPSGATVGVERDIDVTLAAVQRAVASGYTRIKLKIKPGWDEQPLERIRSAYPDLAFLADANGGYAPEHIEHLAGLDRYAPIVLEQPLPAGAWIHSAALQARTSAPVCLDEPIGDLHDIEQLIHLKAARMVNLKVGRVGGIADALRIHDRCAEAGIGVFVGSKTETGVGRWTNIALGTLPHVGHPSDVAASERYFVDEIVRDPVELAGPGCVRPLPGPGFGTEVDPARLAKYTIRAAALPE